MRLNNKKFGVEIECFVPVCRGYTTSSDDLIKATYEILAAKLRQVGLSTAVSTTYQPNYHCRSHDTTNWLVERDGSLVGGPGFIGVEITSPPLKGKAGMDQVRKVCRVLRDWGAFSNDSCGFHVHHEIDRSLNTKKLNQFFFSHQEALFSIIKRDRETNDYCRPLRESDINRSPDDYGGDSRRNNRRIALNLEPFSYGHIEFRLHHGTTRFAEIANWVLLTQSIVETSQVNSRQSPRLKLLHRVLSQGPMELEELQRVLSNLGHEFTVKELDTITGCYASIGRVTRAERIVVMLNVNKSPLDALVEALNITNTELHTLILGRYMLRKERGDLL